MARSLIWVITALIALGNTRDADACKTPPPCTTMQPFATTAEGERGLLEKDMVIVARSLVTLIQHNDPKSMRTVHAALLDGKLAKAILKAPDGRRCLLPTVMYMLGHTPLGRFTLVTLMKTKEWDDGGDLTEAMLRASGGLTSVGDDVFAFWKKYAKPNDGFVNVTTQALLENGNPESLELFESLFSDPKHDVETRKAWLHTTFIERRYDSTVLHLAQRLIGSKLPAQLRTAVAEATFDYRQRWYGTCPGPTPPAASKYSTAAREIVKEIAATVRASKPDAALAKAITKLLADLDKP